jgi:hypothetical protein
VDRPEESVHFFDGELVSEGRALGPYDSIRHVVEFTDFFCPHCQVCTALPTSPPTTPPPLPLPESRVQLPALPMRRRHTAPRCFRCWKSLCRRVG